MTTSNKSAIVFAGSRGIGRATAIRLANDGAAVAVGYASNKEAADDVVKAITSKGGKAISVQVDVSSSDAVANAFDDARWISGQVIGAMGAYSSARSGRLRQSAVEKLSGWENSRQFWGAVLFAATSLTLSAWTKHLFEGATG